MKRLLSSARYAVWFLFFIASTPFLAAEIPVPTKTVNKNTNTVSTPIKSYRYSDIHKFFITKSDFIKYQERLGSLITSKIEYRDKYLVSVRNKTLSKIPNIIYKKMKNNDYMNLIQIRGVTIDTTKKQRKIPDVLTAPKLEIDRGRLSVVQFSGPIKREWVELLGKDLEVIHYVNNNAYLVWGTGAYFNKTVKGKSLSGVVQWTSDYHPLYKIDPNIDLTSAEQVKIDVLFYDSKGYPASINKDSMSKMSGRIFSTDKQRNNRSRIRLEIPANKIAELARLPEIISIVKYYSPQLGGERQAQIVADNLIYDGVVCDDDPGVGVGDCVPSGPGYLSWLAAAPRSFSVGQFAPAANPDFFVVDFGDSGIDLGSTAIVSLSDIFEDGSGNSRLNYVQHMTCPGGVCSFNTTELLNDVANPNDDNSDPFEHGTLVASVIAGHYSDPDVATNDPVHESATNYGYGMGIAPFVHIGSTRVFDIENPLSPPSTAVATYNDMTSLSDWFHNSYVNNARISSNSWSNNTGPTSRYDSFSEQIDGFVRDSSTNVGNQEMVFVFLAGNTAAELWDQGATAKNAIVVGGSENVDSVLGGCLQAASGQYADNAMDIVINSSSGPTEDGRFKPDLVAPGSRITGVRTGTVNTFHDPVCPEATSGDAVDGMTLAGSSAPGYIRRLGTSFAAPAVAGGAALLRQWFINKKNNGMATDANFVAPSPAMTKAWLMNTTTYMTGVRANDNLPSSTQGMGRLNLHRALNATPRITRDQLTVLNVGDGNYNLQGTTSSGGEPFRVTLAWTDAPGTAGDPSTQLRNNLDLSLCVSPSAMDLSDGDCDDGTLYRGNNYTLAESQIGGVVDTANNVESIWLTTLPASTDYIIRVQPTSITSDGIPGVGGITDQDFALIVYNTNLNLVNTGIAVNEGSTTTLTTTDLSIASPGTDNNNIIFTISDAASLPDNGELRLGPDPSIAPAIVAGGSFTLQDIINGEVAYVHDSTETAVDNFMFTVTDGYGATTGMTETFNITVTLNDSPIVQLDTNPSPTLNYTGQFDLGTGAAVSITDAATISDTENDPIQELTVTIIDVNLLNGADESLELDGLPIPPNTTASHIDYSYDSVTGILSLTPETGFTPTIAEFTAALNLVRYDNNAATPDTTSRIIETVVTDSSDVSATATSTINYQRRPIDVAFVLDTSGSMNATTTTSTRIQLMKDAMNLLLDAWDGHDRPEDRLGVLFYNTAVNPPALALQNFGPNWATINGAPGVGGIQNETAAGWTATGAGLQTAIQGLFSAPPDALVPNHRPIIMLLTDGRQNRSPMVMRPGTEYMSGGMPPVLGDVDYQILAATPGNLVDDAFNVTGVSIPPASPALMLSDPIIIDPVPPTTLDAPIFTIGLGVTAGNNLGDMLTKIANDTGALVPDGLGGSNPGSSLVTMPTELTMANSFIDMLSAALDETSLNIVGKVGGNVEPKQIKKHSFTLNPSTTKASFILSWTPLRKKNSLVFALVAPNGQVIPIGTRNVDIRTKDFYTMIHLKFPLRTPFGIINPGGKWKMLISETFSFNNDNTTGSLDYAAWVLENENVIKERVRPGKTRYSVGDKILVTASLKYLGKAAKNLIVQAKVNYPRTGLGNFLSKNKVPSKILTTTLRTGNTASLSAGGVVTPPVALDVPTLPVDKKLDYLLAQPELIKLLAPRNADIKLVDDGTNGDVKANDGIYTATFSDTKLPGSYEFDIDISGQLAKGVDISRRLRTTTATVINKIDRDKTVIDIKRIDKSDANIRVTFTPTDRFDNLLGPGKTHLIAIKSANAKLVGSLIDNLDGSYTQLVSVGNLFGDTIKFNILGTELIVETGVDPRVYWIIIFILLLLVIFALYKLLKKQP